MLDSDPASSKMAILQSTIPPLFERKSEIGSANTVLCSVCVEWRFEIHRGHGECIHSLLRSHVLLDITPALCLPRPSARTDRSEEKPRVSCTPRIRSSLLAPANHAICSKATSVDLDAKPFESLLGCWKINEQSKPSAETQA